MIIPSHLAFDRVIPSPRNDINSVAVSPDGTYALISSDNSEYRGTFLEKIDSATIPPVKIHESPAHTVGFFGRNIRMVAFECDGVLHIYNLELLKTIRRMKILPGSLFVSSSGDSPYIGAVTEGKRRIFYLDEMARHFVTETILKEDSIPVWSSSTTNGIFSSGQAWSEDNSVKISIRSYEEDSPSIATSDSPVRIFQGVDSAMGDESIQRTLFTTMDEPNVVKKLEKRIGSISVDMNKVAEISNKNAIISNVITDNNLKPSMAVSYSTPIPEIALLTPENDYTNLLATRIYRNTNRCELYHSGISSLISFIENPAMSPVIDVQSYSISGRPIKRLECQTPVGCVAGENSINSFETSDSRIIEYRTISKWSTNRAMVKQAVIIPDTTGKIIGGGYSPMVSTLVSSGVAVIVVSANNKSIGQYLESKTAAADMSELAKHVLDKRIAERVGAIFDNDCSTIAKNIIESRKFSKRFNRVDIFEPDTKSEIALAQSTKSVHTRVNIVKYNDFDSVQVHKDKVQVIYLHHKVSEAIKYLEEFWGNN